MIPNLRNYMVVKQLLGALGGIMLLSVIALLAALLGALASATFALGFISMGTAQALFLWVLTVGAVGG